MTSRRVCRVAIVLWLFLACIQSLAQETWAHIYGACDSQLSCNGNFASQAPDFALLPDEGCLFAAPVVGPYGPLEVVRLDRHGNLVWAKMYTTLGILYRLLADSSGAFYLIGLNMEVEHPIPGWIVKCDPLGTILWQKYYANEGNWYGGVLIHGEDPVVLGQYSHLTRISGISGEIEWDAGFYVDQPPNSISYESIAAQETADKGVAMLLRPASTSEGVLLVKTDNHGDLSWARQYPDLRLDAQDRPLLAITKDAGFLFTAALADAGNQPVVVRLDSAGGVLWTKHLQWTGDAGPWRVLCQGAIELPDGGILIKGGAGYVQDGHSYALNALLRLDGAGNPVWSRGWDLPTPLEGMTNMFAVADGVLIAGSGTDDIHDHHAVTLVKVDNEGRGPGACRPEHVGILSVVDAAVAELERADFRQTTNPFLYSSNSNVQPLDVTDIPDRLLCGDSFPGIMIVQVLHNPFRLKVTGWHFQQGSTALINGVRVPSSAFKGTLSTTGQTRLVLGGGGRLKAMLPKGQAVCITVLNPGGHTSECFTYTR